MKIPRSNCRAVAWRSQRRSPERPGKQQREGLDRRGMAPLCKSQAQAAGRGGHGQPARRPRDPGRRPSRHARTSSSPHCGSGRCPREEGQPGPRPEGQAASCLDRRVLRAGHPARAARRCSPIAGPAGACRLLVPWQVTFARVGNPQRSGGSGHAPRPSAYGCREDTRRASSPSTSGHAPAKSSRVFIVGKPC